MFEKLYRILVLILLVILVMGMAAAVYLPIQLEQVRQIRCAQTLLDADLSDLLTNYKSDVYDNPAIDNINKQIFMQGEYQFLTQIQIGLIIAACK